MRYILRSAVVNADELVSVGIGTVAGVSQPHLTPVLLKSGKRLQLSTKDLRFGTPQVGDYWVTDAGGEGDGRFEHKADFESRYVPE